MTDPELDLLMRRVLMDSLKNDMDMMLKESPISSPTARYRQQMRMMLDNPIGWARRRTRPTWQVVAKIAAMIILTSFIAIKCLIIVSPTAYASVTYWIQEIYETYIQYTFVGEDSSGNTQFYEISHLPYGFFEADRFDEAGIVRITYKNSDNEEIILQYMPMNQGAAISISHDNAVVRDITVQGMEGRFYQSTDDEVPNTVIWFNYRDKKVFLIDAFVNLDEIICLAESVSVIYTKDQK